MLPGPIKALPRAPPPSLGTQGQHPPPLVLEPRAAIAAAVPSSAPPMISAAAASLATRTAARAPHLGKESARAFLALSPSFFCANALRSPVAAAEPPLRAARPPLPLSRTASRCIALASACASRRCPRHGLPCIAAPPRRATVLQPWRRRRGRLPAAVRSPDRGRGPPWTRWTCAPPRSTARAVDPPTPSRRVAGQP